MPTLETCNLMCPLFKILSCNTYEQDALTSAIIFGCTMALQSQGGLLKIFISGQIIKLIIFLCLKYCTEQFFKWFTMKVLLMDTTYFQCARMMFNFLNLVDRMDVDITEMGQW